LIGRREYFGIRTDLLKDSAERIIALEERYMKVLLEVLLEAAPGIARDFNRPKDLVPFWTHYPPEQRGRAYSGTSTPWGEMGEKAVDANFTQVLYEKTPALTYPGLPGGSDLRFATEDALIHFDFKVTGPNDRDDEIVASPNQISGDGSRWEGGGAVGWWEGGGVLNSPFTVVGRRGGRRTFQPTLPPFYVLDGRVLLCLTYFLKVVYAVRAVGDQPLNHLELVCVPNGLLLFDGPGFASVKGLLTPGKDETTVQRPRTRVRFDPLARIAGWRCVRLEPGDHGWAQKPRYDGPARLL
jgi:hypothetical protein